jgi:DNA modification methylase
MSLIHADARALPLRDGCVQTCVTSPPYFGLRDYGHADQIGLEPTPEAYIANLVQVFREVRRVLRDDGTVWLNLGDSYAAGGKGGGGSFPSGCKEKDLLGIPWAVAFALRDDGWYLRSDIIWAKPNPMPESVTDRPTKSHEYLFLLAKSERYYYDAQAIAETSIHSGRVVVYDGDEKNGTVDDSMRTRPGSTPRNIVVLPTRNRRSVWQIATMPYAGAHFATMPEALVEPCILAGSRPGDLVLDPFIGSGTVGAVGERFGRRWVGTDLSYHDLAKKRTQQQGLRFGSMARTRPANPLQAQLLDLITLMPGSQTDEIVDYITKLRQARATRDTAPAPPEE